MRGAGAISTRRSLASRSSEAACLQLAAGRCDDPARIVERAFFQLERQQPVPLVRAGHGKRSGLFGREAEAPVVRRIADQQDRPVAEPARLGDGMAHQRRADAGVLQRRLDGERSEQQGAGASPRPRPTACTVPTTRPSAARATNASPSDGLRPRRSFSDDLRLRPGPMARSSSASRAATSAAVSAAMAKAAELTGLAIERRGASQQSDIEKSPSPKSFTSGGLFHERTRAGAGRRAGRSDGLLRARQIT